MKYLNGGQTLKTIHQIQLFMLAGQQTLQILWQAKRLQKIELNKH